MKRRKKGKYILNRNDLIELKEMGYEVHEFTPWHFRIYQNREFKYLDVFPTTRVYCFYELGEYKGKGNYEDMIEIAEKKLDDFI